MEKCKHCGAELDANSTVCPQCGEVNVKEAGAAKLSAGKTALVVVSVLVMLVAMVGMVYVFHNSAEAVGDETVAVAPAESVAEVPEETVAPTIPADGDPGNVTAKGTYYTDDATVSAARTNVIATAGDRELTNGVLQVFYWMEVRNFLTQYGAYAAYFGLDVQQSMDTQVFTMSEEPMTWQQYFLSSALGAWESYSAMAAEAEAAGFQLSDAQQAALDGLEADLEETAKANGFASAADMLHSSMGQGAELEDYKTFMTLYYKANSYFNAQAAAIQPTDADVEAYFTEHADGYAESGITKDTVAVNVRHILVYPEGADGGNIFTDEFSEEAWAAGEAAANALLEQWLAGDKTEESFAALANEHSQDPGSNTNGGLYEDVTAGEMVQAFNDWCFDPARQVGDTGVVRTEYGFHVMFFSASRPLWVEYAKNDYVSEKASAIAVEAVGKNPAQIHYSDILLANVNLT